jgi:hypothetical protein
MTPEQKDALLSLLEQLPAADLEALTRFAEFLLSRAGGVSAIRTGDSDESASATAPVAIPEPEPVPRPDDEKVVAAVKRLSKAYYMLDKKQMLGVTSDLVTQHILHGREAAEVIDELERLFEQQYRQLRQDGQDGQG